MILSAQRWRILSRRALTLLLLGLVSCAYYNTFFVAKKEFNIAEELVRQNTKETLPTEARRAYGTTIKQCRKVLDRHGNSRWADDATYLMAAAYYGIGDYDSALYRLAELEANFPESDLRPDALFLAGLTQTKLREYDQAAALFDQVARDHPDFERGDEILFALAETAEAQRKDERAIGLYADLIRNYPKSLRAAEALQRTGELHFEAASYDSALIYFERLHEIRRGEENEIDAAILQAQTLIRLDRAEEALELLEDAEPKGDEDRPGGGVRHSNVFADAISRIRLTETMALNRLGRYDEAIEKLTEITTKFSSSSYAVEAQFQIGYTYETLIDSLETARAAYDKATTLPGRSIFKDQARQRSEALKSLAELQQEEGSGDTALESRADAALRIAEILYLDRMLVDEAIEKYQEVEEQFPESGAAPRAAYALAYLRWKQFGDSLAAHEEFRDLVVRYPASEAARGAIELLAFHEADTSGLGEILVTPAPETTAVVIDSSVVQIPSGADTTLAVSVDSTLAVSPDSTAAPPADSARSLLREPVARVSGDSIKAVAVDSSETARVEPKLRLPSQPPEASAADSVASSLNRRRAVTDSIARAQEPPEATEDQQSSGGERDTVGTADSKPDSAAAGDSSAVRRER